MTTHEATAEIPKYPTRVVVASESQVKLDAVRDTFIEMGKTVYVVDKEVAEAEARKYLGQENVVVITGVPAKSGINEQPYDHTQPDYMETGRSTGGGMLETLRGAKFRAEDAQKYKPVPFGELGVNFYVTAIENGIFQENGKYIDRGVIVLKTQDHQKQYHDHVYYTKGVEFEPEFVEASRDTGFAKTAAKFMAVELSPDLWQRSLSAGTKLVENDKDPHADICGPKASRSTLLKEKLKLAFREQLSVAPDLVRDSTHPEQEVLPRTEMFTAKLAAYHAQSSSIGNDMSPRVRTQKSPGASAAKQTFSDMVQRGRSNHERSGRDQ